MCVRPEEPSDRVVLSELVQLSTVSAERPQFAAPNGVGLLIGTSQLCVTEFPCTAKGIKCW